MASTAGTCRTAERVVIPGSYARVEASPQGPGAVFMAPIKGFVQAAQIIAFLFVIGGAFSMIQDTGAVTVSVQHLAHTFSRTPRLQKFFIPGDDDALLHRRVGIRHGRVSDAVRSRVHTPGPLPGIRFHRRDVHSVPGCGRRFRRCGAQSFHGWCCARYLGTSPLFRDGVPDRRLAYQHGLDDRLRDALCITGKSEPGDQSMSRTGCRATC